jgi:hypothetical protein
MRRRPSLPHSSVQTTPARSRDPFPAVILQMFAGASSP